MFDLYLIRCKGYGYGDVEYASSVNRLSDNNGNRSSLAVMLYTNKKYVNLVIADYVSPGALFTTAIAVGVMIMVLYVTMKV